MASANPQIPTAVIINVTDHWNLDFTYTNKYQNYTECQTWVNQSEKKNYAVGYRVKWHHIRIPFANDEAKSYSADLTPSGAGSYSLTADYNDCFPPDRTKTDCHGTIARLQGGPYPGTSLLTVQGGDPDTPPAKREAHVIAGDLALTHLDPGTCTDSQGGSVDPYETTSFDAFQRDGDLVEEQLLNLAMLRLRIPANSPKLVEGDDIYKSRNAYTTKLQPGKATFAKDCSEPDNLGGGFRKDKCKQTLANPVWNSHIHIDKVIYG
jgi:hypothetical protein